MRSLLEEMPKEPTTNKTWRGELKRNEPMEKYCFWRTGGVAKQFYQPCDLDDISLFLNDLPHDESVLWFGLGSNLLVRDGGFNGTVIAVLNALNAIEQTASRVLRVEAGVPLAKVARFAARMRLTGAEFMASIPGTMGGALAMNAGAFGSETWQRVVSVDWMDRSGVIVNLPCSAFTVGYRQVEYQRTGYFTAAYLALMDDQDGLASARSRTHLALRAKTQPMSVPSCGSTFRNPPGDHAGRLIESCGLKSHRVGGAEISEKHANFIINRDHATAHDIEMLIELVQQQVKARHDISLELEVHIVGEALS